MTTETYRIVCNRSTGWLNSWNSWEIEASSADEVYEYLEKIACHGCTYEVSKIIVEPVKNVTFDEIVTKRKERLKDAAKLKRKKLFEELKAEFEPG